MELVTHEAEHTVPWIAALTTYFGCVLASYTE
jgi:hypothetical protein